MNAPRVFLVALVCLGFAGSTAYAQSNAGPTKPWKQVRGFGRVLNLTTFPVVIDEPGLYAIDRDWQVPNAAVQANPELISITADDVTLDLHGFEIVAEFNAPPSATLLVITGRRVEIRNGGIGACCDGATAMRAATGPRLHHLSLFSGETMTFDAASITDSEITLRVEARFGARSSLERNTISCVRGFRCIRLLGDDNVFTDNELGITQGGGIEVVGNGSLVANNFIDRTDDVDSLTVFDVKGNHNVVRDNTVLGVQGSFGQPVWVISGTANTLDGNVAAALVPEARARVGMQFTADGNFYGDNRMAAQVPFELGGTVQTDWGGNVGY